MKSTLEQQDNGLHVAIIMDGNGRWAERRDLPRSAGHREGIEAVRRVVEAAPALGVSALTLFAFSSDNWRRPPLEVEVLMLLLRKFLRRDVQRLIENGVRLTGMPGWSTGTPEGEKSSWQLVHFIRRLSTLTLEDIAVMERFNPTSRAQFEEERKIEEFLNGGDTPPATDSSPSADGAKPDPHAGHKKQ